MRTIAQQDTRSHKSTPRPSTNSKTAQKMHEPSSVDRAGPHCACGGGCPRCQTALATSNKQQIRSYVDGGLIPQVVNDVARMPGQPLDAAIRDFMELRFGHDLSNVRVHTDAQAAESARAVEAQAYTVGQHVVFGDGKFAPATHRGRELLAHELAHTIQQRGGVGAPPGRDEHSIHETTARAASRSIAHGQALQQELPAAGIGLSRAPADDDERAKAIAEAEALLARIEKEQKEEEEEEAAEKNAPPPSMRPTTLSLLADDPKFQATLVTDEEIYAGTKEPTPEEPEYWAAQIPESLEKPIKIASATRYIRRWETVTIEMPGDQADRHEDVEISHWIMTRSALRGYLQYMVGDLTPFEESLVQGGVPMPEGLTPVAAGSAIGYYVQSGESGRREHIIYNRDGTTFKSWTSEVALVNMGIGPLVLALPGIGLRGLARSAATVSRTAINIAGRLATRAGQRLRPLAITAKLALGRAEAGAAGAAPTAFGGIASRTSVTLVDAKPLASVVQKVAPVATETAAETTAVQSIPSTAPTAVTATEEVASTGATRPGSVPPVSTSAESLHAEEGGIPDAEISDEAAITQRMRLGERVGEQLGGYTITGDKELVGKQFRRTIYGLIDNELATLPKGGPLRIKKIKNLFKLMVDEARAAGATELEITGKVIRNKNVARVRRFVELLGGTVTKVDAMTVVWVIPVPPL